MMQIRKARPGDKSAIETLAQEARRRFPQLWPWEKYLGRAPFIVVEHKNNILGALLAWPDESPVAWVKLATLDDNLKLEKWLHLTLPPVIDALRPHGIRTLAWMDYREWLGMHLSPYGFVQLTKVVTLSKRDRNLPQLNNPEISLRIASKTDDAEIAAINRAAFSPHWWHSEKTVRHRIASAPYFVIAEVQNRVAGYVEGKINPPEAHLNRIAVHPTYQKRGIGAKLLSEALHAFWRNGVEEVTLNTQHDNHPARRLYHRFGFEPTGEAVTAWELPLRSN